MDLSRVESRAMQLAERWSLTNLARVSFTSLNYVARATRGLDSVALKMFASTPSALRELHVLQTLSGTDCRVPSVLACDTSEHPCALLLSWLQGSPISTSWPALSAVQRLRALRAAGMALGRLHVALRDDDVKNASFWKREMPHAEPFSWPRLLRDRTEKWARRVLVNDTDRMLGVPAAMDDVARRIAGLDARDPITVLHCDFAFRNILYDAVAHTVTGVIDFENAALGDPVYDLAKLSWLDLGAGDAEGRRALLGGWQEAARVEVDLGLFRLYEAIQGLAAMAWSDRHPEAAEAGFRSRARRALLDGARRA